MDTLNRILDLILNNFPSDAAFEDALNIKRKTVDSWKRNNSKSYLNKIVEISKVFHVTTDYLLTGQKSMPEDITQIEKQALLFFRQLNVDGQESALTMLGGLTLNAKYIKKSNETAATGLNQTIA
jgi:hypothetical protein